MKLRLLLPPSLLVLTVVACSGASGTELFGPPESSNLATDPAPSSGGASASGGTDSSGETPPPPSSSSGASGSSSSSSSSSGSSGEVTDAGPDAPPPTPATVRCGGPGPVATTCTAGAEVCCVSRFGRGAPKYTCEPSGFLACTGATMIACDDGTDCPGDQVCCGTIGDNSGYSNVECKAKCNSLPGLRSVRFCDPKAAVDECAASGMTCGQSQALPGYYVCRD